MDGRVGGYLQMDALWTQGRWGSRNVGIFADVIYLRSLWAVTHIDRFFYPYWFMLQKPNILDWYITIQTTSVWLNLVPWEPILSIFILKLLFSRSIYSVNFFKLNISILKQTIVLHLVKLSCVVPFTGVVYQTRCSNQYSWSDEWMSISGSGISGSGISGCGISDTGQSAQLISPNPTWTKESISLHQHLTSNNINNQYSWSLPTLHEPKNPSVYFNISSDKDDPMGGNDFAFV